MVGWPVRRPRKYTVLLLRAVFEWVGSPEEFEMIYSKRVVSSAEVLFCAPNSEVVDDLQRRAQQLRKVPLDGSTPGATTLLTPAQRRRMDEHLLSNRYDSIVADINNEPKFSVAGPFVPPLMHASVLYSSRLGRTALPREHLVMQGIAAYDFLCENDASCSWPTLTTWGLDGSCTPLLSASDIKKLAGNAMHAACV